MCFFKFTLGKNKILCTFAITRLNINIIYECLICISIKKIEFLITPSNNYNFNN